MTLAIDGRHIQDHFPGIGRYTYNLADALPRVAADEQLVVLHNPALRNTRYDIAALAQHPNVELRQVNVRTFSAAEQYALAPALDGCSLFHSPYFIKPYFLRIPSVVTIFDLLPLHFPEAIPGRAARGFFRLAVWMAARTATRILVPSIGTRRDLVTLLNVPERKIDVVPLAADPRFQPRSAGEIAKIRTKYSLPERYALYVGINKPHKNLGTLIQAWHRVEDRTVALVIAGAWDSRYPLVTTDNIRFIHNVPEADLPALYAGATVFVFPSLYEGFGLPPLEAMACGTPVICSNTSSLPEVTGNAAVSFPPTNTQVLTQALSQVLEDSSLRNDLRSRSLARAAQFSWERTAHETLAIYKQLA